MDLIFAEGQSYYELPTQGMEQLNAWTDQALAAAAPDEVTHGKEFDYVEDSSNVRQLRNGGTLRAYFVKKVKTEFLDLGTTTQEIDIGGQTFKANAGKGISFYIPPPNLRPGQYETSYAISLFDPTERRDRYTGNLNWYLRLSDANPNNNMILSRKIREGYGKDMYYDSFSYQYQPDSEPPRVHAAHMCHKTDLAGGVIRHASLTPERAALDSLADQIRVISGLLEIDEPEFN